MRAAAMSSLLAVTMLVGCNSRATEENSPLAGSTVATKASSEAPQATSTPSPAADVPSTEVKIAPATPPPDDAVSEEPQPPSADELWAELIRVAIQEFDKDAAERVSHLRPLGHEHILADVRAGKGFLLRSLPFRGAPKKSSIYSPFRVTVFQVIDDTSFLGEIQERMIYFGGFDTSELVDGEPSRIEDPLYCTGTYRYSTIAGGTKQIPAFLRVDDERLMLMNRNVFDDSGKVLVQKFPFSVQPTEPPPVVNVDPVEVVEAPPESAPQEGEASEEKDEDAEKKAIQLLRAAQNLIDRGRPVVAKKRLEDLLKKYPNTEAAMDAESMLQSL